MSLRFELEVVCLLSASRMCLRNGAVFGSSAIELNMENNLALTQYVNLNKNVLIYLAVRKADDRSKMEDTLVLDGFDVSSNSHFQRALTLIPA